MSTRVDHGPGIPEDPFPEYATDEDVEDQGGGDASVAVHEAKPDPHPQYDVDAEVAARVTDHENLDPAHPAENVSITPFSSIASTNVQDALEEMVLEVPSHPNLAAHDALGLATDTELAAHTGGTDPHADRAYADSIAQGLVVKDSVRVATTANITLAGTQTIDGIALVAGNRVLVKDQIAGETNGIYDVAGGAWSRSADANSDADVDPGMFCFVTSGTVNASTGWVLITPEPFTLDTTALSFTQFSGAGQVVAGAGLTKTANTLDIIGDSSITVAADQISVASNHGGSTHAATQAAAEATAAAALSTHASTTISTIRKTGSSALTGAVTLTPGSNISMTQSGNDIAITSTGGTDTDAIHNALADAKGDLFAATAPDTVSRFAVGVNNATLISDSATATGLRWIHEAPPVKFVSTTGSDSTGDGRWDRPFLTLAGAYAGLAALGGRIEIGPGDFTMAGTLTLDKPNVTIRGAGPREGSAEPGTRLLMTAAGTDMFTWATGAYFTQFEDIELSAGASAGHIFNQGASCAGSQFHRVRCLQSNPAKSIWYDNDGFDYIDVLWEGCNLEHVASATVPAFYLYSTRSDIQSNTWFRCRATYSGNYFFHIEAASSTFATNNVFRDMTFEVCDGGLIEILSGMKNTIENCSTWDHGTTTKDLIHISNTGSTSRENIIRNYMRSTGTLGSGKYDIVTGGATLTTIDHAESLPIAGCKINLGSTTGNLLILHSDVSLTNESIATTTKFLYDKGTLSTGRVATASLPSASTVGAGAQAYDTTLGRPVWSNGSAWVDPSVHGGTPAPTLSTSNVAGAASTYLRTDDQLALFDATVPTTQAFGDSAATGSVALAARRDHKHAMPNYLDLALWGN